MRLSELPACPEFRLISELFGVPLKKTGTGQYCVNYDYADFRKRHVVAENVSLF